MVRIKNLLKSKLFRISSVTMLMLMCMTATAFASTPPTVDYSAVTDALTGSFTVAQIGAVIGVVLATGVGFVLFWWGSRKLVRGVMSAFKSGKLKF